MRGLREKAEMLCRRIAPELADAPLYIAMATDLPEELSGLRSLHGATLPNFDLILEPHLRRQRRWRGRGLGFCLSSAAIAPDAKHRPREYRKRDFEESFLGVALHEFCHTLDADFRQEVDSEPPSPERVGWERLVLGKVAISPGGPQLRGHEHAFIRRALHLVHRAKMIGVDVCSASVFNAMDYKLSATFRYENALGDEPRRLAGSTFAEIAETPPPKAFCDLWRRDLLRLLLPVKTIAELKKKLATLGERKRLFIPTNRRPGQ